LNLIAAVLTLLRNAVPFLGVALQEWAAPAALLLYLGENIVLAVLAATFVRLRAPREEVIEGERKSRRESLRTFGLLAGGFTFGSAVITTFVVLAREEYEVDTKQLLGALGAMIVLQLIAFATNLSRARTVTLAQCETMLVGIIGRVVLVAFAVWAGLLAAIFIGPVFVIPFMLLKALVDLSQLRPEVLKRRLLRAV
jgi:hypothetical protein